LGHTEVARIEGDASDNSFGFHGGTGFELNIGNHMAFFIEGAVRYAKLKNWEGEAYFCTPIAYATTLKLETHFLRCISTIIRTPFSLRV